MAGGVFRIIELTGTSPNSIEEAVKNALSRTGQTVRHLRWFQVIETRGTIEEGQVGEWQVTLKIGFRVEETNE
jgi:flavin-binding protein dodecin